MQQAEHWRHRLIRDGTELEPGTRLIESRYRGRRGASQCSDRSSPGSSSTALTSSRSSLTLHGGTSIAPASRQRCVRPTHSRSRSRISSSTMSG